MSSGRKGDLCGVIVAAGRSTRFGEGPKALADLLGRPVLEWSVQAHAACERVRQIVVVGQSERRGEIETVLKRAGTGKDICFVEGGAERQASVRRGLEVADENSALVSIHDAARPGVTPELIARVAAKAGEMGAAVAAMPVRDTVKRCASGGFVEETLDRSCLWRIATPQIFRRELIIQAHRHASGPATDDAALVERLGHAVMVVESDERIQKITTPADLRALEGMLGADQPRVGFGYDIHQTDPERALYLGGVHFPEGPGLAGHSDADVVCHAVADALLGAAALGDIGRHFPNADPAYAGVSSLEFLKKVAGMLQSVGARIVNVDVTLIAERPKIAPRADEMRACMAASLGITPERMSVKATTAEKTGPAGRGECMEAHAVAQIVLAGKH